MIRRLSLFTALLITLSACSIGGEPVTLTVIEPQVGPIDLPAEESVNWAVEVQRPRADQMRDSDRMIVRRGDSRLQLYPGLAWLESAPDLYQALLVDALRESRRFAGVARSGSVRAPLGLLTELRRFDLVDDGQGRRAELVIAAQLVDQRTGRVRAQQTLRHEAEVSGSGTVAVVQAFESALSNSLRDTLQWMLSIGPIPIDDESESD